MLFEYRFQIIFIVGSTSSLFILPKYLNNFGGISHRHSQHLKTKEEFSSKSCLFSRRFMVLASCYPLKLFGLSGIFSYPSGVCQELFSISFHRSTSFHKNSSSSHLRASIKYSLISSRSLRSLVSKFPQPSSCLFFNSSRRGILILHPFSNSHGGSFMIPFPLCRITGSGKPLRGSNSGVRTKNTP